MVVRLDLQNDREIVLEAVKNNECALEYASKDLWNDREYVLEAVKDDGYALEFASEAIKNDREIVLKAVKNDGHALESASEGLKNDREIVLGAVKSDGRAQDHKNDREIVLEAVKNYGDALEYASEDIKNDREWILILLYSCREYDDITGSFISRIKKQLELLSKESQSKLVEGNTLNAREAIHFASENGFALAMKFIMEKNRGLRHTMIERDRNKYRPLHRAAKGGHLEACKALLKYGGHVKSTNGTPPPLVLAQQEQSKLDLFSNVAKRNEFDKVIQLLKNFNMRNNGIGGVDAYEKALTDVRQITTVEWFTCPLEGWAVAIHLAPFITVGEDSTPTEELLFNYAHKDKQSIRKDKNSCDLSILWTSGDRQDDNEFVLEEVKKDGYAVAIHSALFITVGEDSTPTLCRRECE